MCQLFAWGGQTYWSFYFSIIPSKEIPGLISFRIDWLDLLAVQGTLESSPTPQFKSINSSALSFLHCPTFTSIHDYWKNHSFDYMKLCWILISVFHLDYCDVTCHIVSKRLHCVPLSGLEWKRKITSWYCYEVSPGIPWKCLRYSQSPLTTLRTVPLGMKGDTERASLKYSWISWIISPVVLPC